MILLEAHLRSSFASHFGAPGKPSPATSVLPVNLRQQLRRSRQQLRRSWSALASNFGAPSQPSPATAALPFNLASNFGAPSPATSALPVNLRQQLRQDFVIRCKCSPKFEACGILSSRLSGFFLHGSLVIFVHEASRKCSRNHVLPSTASVFWLFRKI